MWFFREPGAAITRQAVIPLFQGVILLYPCPDWKGVVGVNVVTYEELFQLLMVLITFASLIITIIKKK